MTDETLDWADKERRATKRAFRYWKAPRSWCYVEDVEVCDRRQW